MRRVAAIVAIASLLCVAGSAVLAGGRRVTGYEPRTSCTEGLAEPIAVAVLADGSVAVADIATDRITSFDASGQPGWSVSPGLDHPSGLGISDRGLWVADSGNHRLVLLSPADGALLETIALDSDLHPIDVCEDSDGRLWVAASPEDRLLVLDADGAVVLEIDEADGAALEGPRGLASDGEGGMFVAEALGGRVLHLGSDGHQRAVLARWGPGEGEFYKPKDVAVLADGGLVVVDSHHGLAQILERDGTFRQLVSGPDAPHQFGFPVGIAAHGDSLLVADAGAAEVVRLEPAGSAWLDGRIPPAGIAASAPSVRDEDPSSVCRQCHDGTRMLSVGNWDPAATNHPLQLEDDADVPARFRQTDDGGLMCLTCHSVHVELAGDAAPGIASDVIDFGLSRDEVLPSRFPGNDLCVECHHTYLDTESSHRRKSHPIGLEPPSGSHSEELVAAGARFEGDRLVCMSCHPPHGAHADPLLIREATGGDLCVSCHEDHASGVSRHAVDVEVDRITRNRVEAMGGVFADDGHLTCLSCHDLHLSTSATLLRTGQSGTNACRACHLDQSRAIRDGGHGDATCEQCHGMHTLPAGFGDGQGMAGLGPAACLDCHADGGADTQISPWDSHPMAAELEPGEHGALPPLDGLIGCTTCHETHAGNDLLLRSADGVAPLCLECHPEQGTVLGTDHDARIVAAGDTDHTCVSCHDAHGSAEPYLIADVPQDTNPANARCLLCHDGSTDAIGIEHYTHPERLMLTVGGLPFRYAGSVPYFAPDGEPTEDREVGEITCMTCHDPHRWRHDAEDRPGAADGTELNSFLRDPDEIVHFCEVCHGLEGRPQFRFFHEDEYRLTLDQDEESP